MTLRMIDTFSGIGGFSLAARWLGGIETVQFVEREPFCQRILAKHWPTVPIHDDICTFNPEPHSADIVCGGFPCQDLSRAGTRQGLAVGTRSGLFYELARIVRVVRPRYVVLENSPEILGNAVGAVYGAMAKAGYDIESCCIPASDLAADHIRDRWWQIAYLGGKRLQGGEREGARRAIWAETAIGRGLPIWQRPTAEPALCRAVHGLPGRLDRHRIRALGNAVVPQVAMIPLARVLELEWARLAGKTEPEPALQP